MINKKGKEEENKKKWVGGCSNLLVVNRQRREDFCLGAKGGLDRMGMGRPLKQTLFGTTVQIASIYWVRYSFYLIYLNGNLTAMRARAKTWTEDIVAVHVRCIAAAI